MFETGTNRWRHTPAWPPRGTKPFSLYFHPGGRLGTEPPGRRRAGHTGFDEYVSDPAKPVPSSTRSVFGCCRIHGRRPALRGLPPGRTGVRNRGSGRRCHARRAVARRSARVSTSGTDSDWIVKLIDVYPADSPDPDPNPTGVRMGGYQQLVRGEVMRGQVLAPSSSTRSRSRPANRPRSSLSCPTSITRSAAGHKIMVQVQSSWFPLVDRNPQTFVDIYHASDSDFRRAVQRVYRSSCLAIDRGATPSLSPDLPAYAWSGLCPATLAVRSRRWRYPRVSPSASVSLASGPHCRRDGQQTVTTDRHGAPKVSVTASLHSAEKLDLSAFRWDVGRREPRRAPLWGLETKRVRRIRELLFCRGVSCRPLPRLASVPSLTDCCCS